MEGRTLAEVTTPDLLALLEPRYRAALAGEVVRFDNASSDGAAVYRTDIAPVREGGEVVGGIAVSRDVTEAHLAAAAMAESERNYRALAEQSTDLISRHRPDGTFLYASPAARQVLGYEPEELVGRRAFDLHHPDDLATEVDLWRLVLESQQPRKVEYRFRNASGTWTWVESTAHSI